MYRKLTVLFIIAILTINSVYGGSDSNKVAVLYHGSSQINRNTLKFMGGQFKDFGSQYQFQAFNNSSEIQADVYKAIIVLNTGNSSGIDPVLSEFIDSWQNKSEIILVNLYKDSSDLTVETIPSDNNPQSVDAVSAASLWKERGLANLFKKNSAPKQMHEQWVQEVLNLINGKV